MPPTDTDTTAPEVKIEDIGPAAKRLTITVSPEAVAEKLESSMGTLASETALPGFRKGRAPRALLERRFGTAVRQETRNQVIADAYASVIEQHKLKPVGDPEPVEKVDELELEAGKPLVFAVDVEVVPEFELPDLKGIEIRKPMLDITDELVEKELDRYRRQLGTVHRVEDDFQAGDRIVGRATVTKNDEDEPFFTHDQVVVVVPGDEDGGRGQILGLMIDGLAGMLAGRKVTDSIKIDTIGPEAHEREDLRGAKIAIDLEINQAERIEPATTEKVVETLGLGTAEILTEQVRMALEQRRDEEQAEAMRMQVAEHLEKAVDFELPAKLSERQVGRNLERMRLEMLYRGVPLEDVETRLAEARNESEASVRRRLKMFFLNRKLASNFDIEVTQQEINGRVASMAASRGERPEKLMQELSQAGRIGEIATQISDNKALDRVVQDAKITEISAEEWRELYEAKAAGGASPDTKSSTTKKSTSKKKTTTKKTSSKKKTSTK